MKRIILAMGLVLSFLVLVTFAAFAQDPGDPTPSPLITIEWNEDSTKRFNIDDIPELTVVSYQVVPGLVGEHDFNFIVDDAWPRQMKWEASMPGSTDAAPVKMAIFVEMSGLPTGGSPPVNPPGRWWAAMKLQLALELHGSVGTPSEWSDKVYCIDWVQKQTGKPKRSE